MIEKEVKIFLKTHFDAYKHYEEEIDCKYGTIDVLTSKLICEIKPSSLWKHALGQVG